jgi:hypothetical protein
VKTSTFLYTIGWVAVLIGMFNIGVEKNSAMDAAASIQGVVLFIGAYIIERLDEIVGVD